ncbi:hypothetical protein [Kitasatospora sp. NPDC085879]|jgi:hypothetical protein|uniref:hypothetical protein n=1 Tax=Kitasatospora sp. NPDC085879 TaxID=3154769 RepID=UPI00343B090E
MGISRRSLLLTAAAASTAGLLPTPSARAAGSPPGDVVGKITVGYQGWFACPGDGAPINGWWHWSQDWSHAPSPADNALRAWPDMREYTAGYRTAYSPLGDGTPAALFSSYDQQTVDTHFRWMREYGCDTAALQRFNPNGRKFYVMYDVSGWTSMQEEIKADWTNRMSRHTASPAYARQNGMPVVGIWGFGFDDANHPWSPAACLDVISWFRARGCYLMGGVPTYWRTGANDSRPGYLDVYHAFHMLSPWMVGRIGTAADSDRFLADVQQGDQAEVLGSTDGTAFTTLAGAAGYRFDPATGNTAALTLPAAAQTRYVRLQFTGNTGWPAGQLSALQVLAQ